MLFDSGVTVAEVTEPKKINKKISFNEFSYCLKFILSEKATKLSKNNQRWSVRAGLL